MNPKPLYPQIQPSKISCFPTAFAIVIGIPVIEIFNHCGHDGSEKIFPRLDEPFCYRGFHRSELIIIARKYGWAVTEIDYIPYLLSIDDKESKQLNSNEDYINNECYLNRKIIMGATHRNIPHVIVKHKDLIIDPASQLINSLHKVSGALIFDWIKY